MPFPTPGVEGVAFSDLSSGGAGEDADNRGGEKSSPCHGMFLVDRNAGDD